MHGSRRVRSWWPLLLAVVVGGCAETSWTVTEPPTARLAAAPSLASPSPSAIPTAAPSEPLAAAAATLAPGAVAATCLPLAHQKVVALGWSPDGSTLALLTKPDPGYGLNGSALGEAITLVRYPSLAPSVVYEGSDLISEVAVGPDDRTVYYTAGRSTGNGIWAVETGGTPRLVLATTATDAEAGLTATPKGLVRDVSLWNNLTDLTSMRHALTFVDWKGNSRSLGDPYPGVIAWVSADTHWVMTSTMSQSATIWHDGAVYAQIPLQAGLAIAMDRSQTGLFTIVGNEAETAFDVSLVQITGAAGWSYPIASSLTSVSSYGVSSQDAFAFGGEGAACFLDLGI